MITGKNLARLAGAGAAATIAVGLLSTGAAHADTFVPLPGGEIVKTLSDGTVVTVRLAGESATISSSMGATPVHRNAWVSGSAQIELSGADTGASAGIFPGYTVGCQANIAGGGVNGGAAASVDTEGSVSPSASSGGSLSLGPGQAQSFYVLDLERPDGYGNESHKTYNWLSRSTGSVTWSDETIGLSGCGGYAQARAFVSVEVITDSVTTWITLWGQPFSLG
ncbi:MspA family porin [Nocardia sp. NPDC051750]|uniref:MspA family porin n=1 Tax=Nocardia sp. NPDC051750 TaxID=3364325 RepID=UPI003798F690